MQAIAVDTISKRFGEMPAVQDVTFSVEAGQILVLLGKSGCGKTTTLRLIAGLERPDSGSIRLKGEIMAGPLRFVAPEARQIGMVFQDYALFPHLTVAENIAFPLSHMQGAARKTRIEEMLAAVGLKGLGSRYPHQLSGGEQQRVALARALAPNPSVVLLDEPFSNLDATLRLETREEVRRILREAGATAIFVTHDQEEALSIADRVAVLRGGRLLQLAAPHDLYLRPVNREVALFMGEANFIAGQADGGTVRCALGDLWTLEKAQGSVQIMIRPEMLRLDPDPQGNARVEQIRFFGHDQMVRLSLADGTSLQARTWARADLRPEMCVQVRVHGPVLTFA
jgi:iron(III) transport system ATP-binding protein